jgi:multiple sugar transport system substrate-binding protein
MRQRSRALLAVTAMAAAATVLAACSGGSNGTTDSSAGGSTPPGSSTSSGSTSSDSSAPSGTISPALTGTISLWYYFSDREAEVMQSVINKFEAANPGIKVVVHGSQDDEKITKVISSGGDIDVAMSPGTDNLGAFCSSGAYVDLGPYMKKNGVADSTFVGAALDYTKFNGVQCALPMMTDMYGLYYNKDLFEKAGLTAPPKTLSELKDMALKLTTYHADGSIKTLGFNPLIGFYENQSPQWSFITGATWMKDGKSTIADDPAWSDLITWQKSMVDAIGYDKLKAFTAGLGDEWSADEAFQTGQVAMMLDGEWRTAFIKDQAPKLNYATAPFPTGDKYTDLYGGGYSSGTTVGMAKTAKNKDLAFKLIQYLTTDTGVMVTLANELGNVPTTHDGLTSPDLKGPDQFKTFLSIADSGHVLSLPNTAIGSGTYTTLDDFWQSYQSGTGGDLAAGLKKVDEDINNALALSDGP